MILLSFKVRFPNLGLKISMIAGKSISNDRNETEVIWKGKKCYILLIIFDTSAVSPHQWKASSQPLLLSATSNFTPPWLIYHFFISVSVPLLLLIEEKVKPLSNNQCTNFRVKSWCSKWPFMTFLTPHFHSFNIMLYSKLCLPLLNWEVAGLL